MATTAPRTRRSFQEWDELAREILPELQAGRSIADLRDRIGTNGDALRTALARMGYDPQGEPMAVKELTAATPKTLAKRVAKRRQEGAPWWLLRAETGKTYTELRQGLAEYGYDAFGNPIGNGTG